MTRSLLATAVGLRTERIGLTLGPLAVAVRDPAMIAMGVASVAAITGRPVGVALGTSSPVVVEQWHGRSRRRSAVALAESARVVRRLLAGARSEELGELVGSTGYRLRLPPPRSPLTVAAFGPAAVRVAARYADRMVVNLVSPRMAGDLVRDLDVAWAAQPTEVEARPRVAAWVVAAVDAGPVGVEQLRRGVVGYLAAPGYGEMFAREGFAELVAYARTRPHPKDLLAAIPDELVAAVGLIGDGATARDRIEEYQDGRCGRHRVGTRGDRRGPRRRANAPRTRASCGWPPARRRLAETWAADLERQPEPSGAAALRLHKGGPPLVRAASERRIASGSQERWRFAIDPENRRPPFVAIARRGGRDDGLGRRRERLGCGEIAPTGGAGPAELAAVPLIDRPSSLVLQPVMVPAE